MLRADERPWAPCAVIPVFNHEDAVGRVVAALRAVGLPVLLVDDGSQASCARVLDQLAEAPGVSVLHLPCNRGKGAAVMAGFTAAEQLGYTHALQVDADGQHALHDVPRFLEESRLHPQALICGAPVFDASIPKFRYYGRYLTHALVWLHTLSFEIRDSMCGFRVYPLARVCALIREAHVGARMDFDIEVVVRLHWRGMPLRWLETAVTYPLDGISHFRLYRDNLRIASCHARLFLGMVARLPRLLARRLTQVSTRASKQGAHA